MYLAPGVERTLFRRIFTVVRSAVYKRYAMGRLRVQRLTKEKRGKEC